MTLSTGWVCPLCRTVYAPTIPQCWMCRGLPVPTYPISNAHLFTIRLADCEFHDDEEEDEDYGYQDED